MCFAEKRPFHRLRCPYLSSISRSGIITKSRSCMWGWGRVSDGVLMCRSSYVSMSMSIGRSWYCPFTDLVVRPSCCSMSLVVARSCSGDRGW